MRKTATPMAVYRQLAFYCTFLFLTFSTNLPAQHTDPGMNGEHEAAMDLVPVSAATRTASADGNWTSGATWNTGTVPGAGSRVSKRVSVQTGKGLPIAGKPFILRSGRAAWLPDTKRTTSRKDPSSPGVPADGSTGTLR